MHELRAHPIKVPSADLTNLPLLRKIAALGAPVILSTGMSEMREIDVAVNELTAHHDDVALLHCNSSYPCPDSETRVRAMLRLRDRYGLPTGYSGHEKGLGPSLAAAALGACIVERHFTLDKTLSGTDHKASLVPEEFAELARTVRSMEAAMLTDEKLISPAERSTATKLRKSVVFARPLSAGHLIREKDIRTKCPGTGVSPLHWDEIIGTRLCEPVEADQLFSWELVVGARETMGKALP
jgi:N-acetylneuraminate synthase/sialic acid synthase